MDEWMEVYCKIYFRCKLGQFLRSKNLLIINALLSMCKNKQGVGASFSVLLCYPQPVNCIYERYPNKDKCDALGGEIFTRI